MAKRNQPYIPYYTGDHLKETRVLTLAAKGAWIDLQVYMWDAEERGILTGRQSEFARMLGTSEEEFARVLSELCLNRIVERSELGAGRFQIRSESMIRKNAISEKRKASGSKGGRFAQANARANGQAKNEQNTDNDIDNVNDIVIEKKEGVQQSAEEADATLSADLDEAIGPILVDSLKVLNTHLDVIQELAKFKIKVRGSPGFYRHHDHDSLRLAFQSHLRSIKTTNGNHSTLTRKQQQLNRLVEDHEREFGSS